MARATWGVGLLVCVALLSVGSGSVKPAGGEGGAVVTGGWVCGRWMEGVRGGAEVRTGGGGGGAGGGVGVVGAGGVAPPVWLGKAEVPPVAFGGRGSETLAPLTALGPLLLTTMM